MAITAEQAEQITVLRMDDGKANAYDLDFFAELNTHLDACAEAAAVVVTGRPGMFSGGLNTKVMAGLDDAGLTELLLTFGRTMLRLWLEPRPLVAAVSGHAIAGGTILALACDHAVAADGDFKWGLTETSIGFPIPSWVLDIGRASVRADRLDDLVLSSRVIGPAEAVEVGFADVLADPDAVLNAALARARELAALPRRTYGAAKRRLRGPAAERALADLEDDTRRLLAER